MFFRSRNMYTKWKLPTYFDIVGTKWPAKLQYFKSTERGIQQQQETFNCANTGYASPINTVAEQRTLMVVIETSL